MTLAVRNLHAAVRLTDIKQTSNINNGNKTDPCTIVRTTAALHALYTYASAYYAGAQ